MTDALDRFRRIGDALPPGGMATLSREFIIEVAESLGTGRRDLTVPEVAEHFGRSVSCIRSWLQSGDLRGYRLRGREWRIPPAALAEFEAAQREGRSERNCAKRPSDVADLGAWRSA